MDAGLELIGQESEDETPLKANEESSVHCCALKHIRTNQKRHRMKAPNPIKEMVACWEQHKNNNNNNNNNIRAFAATCYHKLDEEARAPPRKRIKSAMVDTGANITILEQEAEESMTDSRGSRVRIEVADTRCIRGNKDGTVRMHVMKIDKSSHANAKANVTDTGIVMSHKVTTIDNLSRQLFSVDDMYVKGCSILLRAPGYENGIPEIHVPACGQREFR
jgi:hypothetical protein